MAATKVRKIVKIDAAKCNGCGLCIPNCAEGAIKAIDGKARLIGDNLCDGLGNCLGTCPLYAITIEERSAEEFDEHAVRGNPSPLKPEGRARVNPAGHVTLTRPFGPPSPFKGEGSSGPGAGEPLACGCPGSMLRQLAPKGNCADPAAAGAPQPSRLGQWPVQLTLLPAAGPIWQDADVLISADCVAFAMGDFHERLLAGKTLAIACPKLDDVGPYIEKLTTVFAGNDIRSITVAHMEVPCCGGIVIAVRAALERSGKNIPLRDVTVGVDGLIAREG